MSELLADIERWENGTLTGPEEIELFQFLVDSQAIYSLQGFYQRHAARMADAGKITWPRLTVR